MHLRFDEICMNQSITLCNIPMKILIIKRRMLIQKILCSIRRTILSWTWVQIESERVFFISMHLGFHNIFIESIWAIHIPNCFIKNYFAVMYIIVQFHIKMKIRLQIFFWNIVIPNIILKVSFCSKIAEDFFYLVAFSQGFLKCL